jgi:general secretion pathway protein A
MRNEEPDSRLALAHLPARVGLVERYWGLTRQPFQLTSDTAFLYESAPYREGLARLLYNISELRGGLAVVTAPIGCGKTTLSRSLVEILPRDRYRIALIVNPMLSVAQLLAVILSEFGIHTNARRKVDLVAAFNEFLTRQDRARVAPVLLIDEAHLLRKPHLEELRLLMNFEAPDRKLLHIVLFGQPELRDKLVRLPQFAQRVTMWFDLVGLRGDEAALYLTHRLRVAGADRSIFSDKATLRVARLSRGIPRIMNQLATGSLYVAAVDGANEVAVRHVELARRDLFEPRKKRKKV